VKLCSAGLKFLEGNKSIVFHKNVSEPQVLNKPFLNNMNKGINVKHFILGSDSRLPVQKILRHLGAVGAGTGSTLQRQPERGHAAPRHHVRQIRQLRTITFTLLCTLGAEDLNIRLKNLTKAVKLEFTFFSIIILSKKYQRAHFFPEWWKPLMLECWIGWLRERVPPPPSLTAASCAARRERIAAPGETKTR
jgi:hypothetical protein